MDLVIKQNVNQQENGNSALLDLLYNLTKPDPITGQAIVNNATLVGRISVPSAYEDAVNFLNDKFSSEQDNGSDFQVTVLNNNYYIRFADQEVVKVLLENGIGDGTGVTVQDAATANLGLIFKNNTTIESFNELQYFSKTLAEGAFYGCSSLKSVTLSDSPTVLNRSIFGSTALISINIPVGYTTVRQNCFSRCSMLAQVSIPSTLTSSEDYAFGNCDALDRVDITDLDAWCEITFGNTSSNPLYYAKHLYLNNTLVTTLDLTNITDLKQYVFCNLESLTSITNFSGLTTIGGSVFTGCTNLVIPNLALPNLTSLGNFAFSGTKVQTISDLGSIINIPSGCFKDCKQLSSVTMPSSLTSIGNSAFEGCSNLQTITLPSNLTTIPSRCFVDCSNLIYTPQSTITVIESNGFYRCKMTNVDVNLPNLTSLGERGFYQTGITSVSDLGSITTVPRECFRNCTSLTSVSIPNGVTSIGIGAFYGCEALTSIIIPDNVTSDVQEWFHSCDALTTVVLGSGITKIKAWAFREDSALRSLTVKAVNPPVCEDNALAQSAIVGYYGNYCDIYVPASSVDAYKTADGWSAAASRIQAIPT